MIALSVTVVCFFMDAFDLVVVASFRTSACSFGLNQLLTLSSSAYHKLVDIKKLMISVRRKMINLCPLWGIRDLRKGTDAFLEFLVCLDTTIVTINVRKMNYSNKQMVLHFIRYYSHTIKARNPHQT